MEKEDVREKEEITLEKGYELLCKANKGKDITVRDDQVDFPWLFDSVSLCRKKGSRFRLIDSGKFDRVQLEWLAEAGMDFYTSDETRTDFLEIELVNKACKKGGGIFAYFLHGSFMKEETKDSSSESFSSLQDMGRRGVFLHTSNRERERDFSQLVELAHACSTGGSWLVYYHHGQIVSSLVPLGKYGTWVHITDQSLREIDDATLVMDTVESVLSGGVRLVLHVEKGLGFALLYKILKARAFILFKSSLFDYKSPLRRLEKKAKQRKVDFRAYYLYPTFLP